MTPYRQPPRMIPVPFTVRQCEALTRLIGLGVRWPECEADAEYLVQALGSIAAEMDRAKDEGEGAEA